MNWSRIACLVWTVVLFLPAVAFGQLNVLHSGGFAGPYRELLPSFERNSGSTVTSTLSFSQGSGPDTIPALLERGVAADVLIMSREGLNDLIARGRIITGTVVDLAQAPLGVAVRRGAPKPDISTVEAFKQLVLRATLINFGSTTGLHLTEKVFPALGIAAEVARKTNGDRAASLVNTQVDLVLRPVSELLNLPGFDYVGPVPQAVQFISVFSAAVVSNSQRVAQAKQLITFLSSEEARAAARRHGMEPLPSGK
jgi:molybdate transport system substrate-binding protein